MAAVEAGGAGAAAGPGTVDVPDAPRAPRAPAAASRVQQTSRLMPGNRNAENARLIIGFSFRCHLMGFPFCRAGDFDAAQVRENWFLLALILAEYCAEGQEGVNRQVYSLWSTTLRPSTLRWKQIAAGGCRNAKTLMPHHLIRDLRQRPRCRRQGLRHFQRQTVLDRNRFGVERDRPGLQAFARGRQRDRPRQSASSGWPRG